MEGELRISLMSGGIYGKCGDYIYLWERCSFDRSAEKLLSELWGVF
jgi:hypothetical protein